MDFGGEGVTEEELPATRAGGSLTKFLTKRQYLDGEKPSSFTPKSPGSIGYISNVNAFQHGKNMKQIAIMEIRTIFNIYGRPFLAQ